MTFGKAASGRYKKGGRRVFFEKKIGGGDFFSTKKRGAKTFFSGKIRGAKTFFRLKKGERRLFSGKFFPKPGLGIK